MQVFVKSITGESITVASIDDSVDSVKETILDIEGIPVEHQRLIFEGKEMEDGRPLSFYNVKQNSTVHLMLRLPGGGTHGPTWKLAAFYIMKKKICRKCYGRLPPNAVKCRKAKCGRTYDIRPKKLKSYLYSSVPRKFSDIFEHSPNYYSWYELSYLSSL